MRIGGGETEDERGGKGGKKMTRGKRAAEMRAGEERVKFWDEAAEKGRRRRWVRKRQETESEMGQKRDGTSRKREIMRG